MPVFSSCSLITGDNLEGSKGPQHATSCDLKSAVSNSLMSSSITGSNTGRKVMNINKVKIQDTPRNSYLALMDIWQRALKISVI